MKHKYITLLAISALLLSGFPISANTNVEIPDRAPGNTSPPASGGSTPAPAPAPSPPSDPDPGYWDLDPGQSWAPAPPPSSGDLGENGITPDDGEYTPPDPPDSGLPSSGADAAEAGAGEPTGSGKANAGGGTKLFEGSASCEAPYAGEQTASTHNGNQTINCTIQMPSQEDIVLNATVLQSVNNLHPDIKWTPYLQELPDLQARIMQGYNPYKEKVYTPHEEHPDPNKEYFEEGQKKKDEEEGNEGGGEDDNSVMVDPSNKEYYNVAEDVYDLNKLEKQIIHYQPKEIVAVYGGEFDLNRKLRSVSVGSSRPYQILGGDILVYEESYDFFRNRYVHKEVESGEITYAQALQAIYKAIHKEQRYIVKAQQYALKEAKEDKIPIGNTPLVSSININNAFVAKDTYYTRTFVSRTLTDIYYEEALSYKILDKTKKKETITLGQFAYLLKEYLYLNGEEVLNEEEENLLVAVYGKDLPYYLKNHELEAVRYLTARGIVEPDLNYADPLTTEDMLNMLMRSKDPASRLDFKKINIEYSEELVALGYYPTNAVMADSPIQDLRIDVGTATASHYDYLIEKVHWYDPETGFKNYPYTVFAQLDPEGFRREVYNIYVADEAQYMTESPLEGSTFVGDVEIEGVEYYHFKVPVNVPEIALDDDNMITINSQAGADLPLQLRLEQGGGIYSNPDESGTDLMFKLEREPFPSEFSGMYVDDGRKAEAQEVLEEGVQLSATKSQFTFVSSDEAIETLFWNGKPLKDSTVFKDNDDGTYTITVEAEDAYKELLLKLSYASNLPAAQMVPAYVKDGRYALVSLNWLKKNKIITDAVEIEKGKWILYSGRHNTLIDLEDRKIVSGQVVTEIMSTDTSPLLIEDPFSKDMLIDYRAISGVSSDYLVVTDTNGNVTLSIPNNTRSFHNSIRVYNLMGSDGSNLYALDPTGEAKVSLEESYPTANYMVYRSRRTGVRTDYLIVAKPTESATDSKTSKLLKSVTGLEFQNGIDIDMWTISGEVLTDADDEQNVAKKTDKVVFDAGTMKYLYKAPKAADVAGINSIFKKYMEAEGSAEYPLPLVQRSDKLLDLNINLIDNETDFAKYPKKLQNPSFTSSMFTGDEEPKVSEMKLALTGIIGIFYPYKEGSWKDMMKNKNTPYMGAIPVKIEVRPNEKVTEFMKVSPVHNSSYELAEVLESSYDEKFFQEVFRGTTKSVYSYDLMGKYSVTGFDDVSESTWGATIESFSKKAKNIFDFAKAYFDNFLENFDLTLTGIMIFLLTVIPRIAIFWFLGYAALSLVHNVRFIRFFCYNVFDIYKILSLGFSNIDRINTKSVWISTFIGIVLAGAMMNSGDFVKLIGFFTEVVIKIIQAIT